MDFGSISRAAKITQQPAAGHGVMQLPVLSCPPLRLVLGVTPMVHVMLLVLPWQRVLPGWRSFPFSAQEKYRVAVSGDTLLSLPVSQRLLFPCSCAICKDLFLFPHLQL